MNWLVGFITGRARDPQQALAVPTVLWDYLTESERAIYRECYIQKLRAADMTRSRILFSIWPGQYDAVAELEIGKRVICVPFDVIKDCIEAAETRPYTWETAMDGEIKIRFIHNLQRVTALMAPAPLLARAAVRDARARGELCAITLERLSECTEFCVGICGHVFSAGAAGLSQCPTCREPVAWARVLATEVDSEAPGHSS